jgi:hypothetical protein
MTGRERILTALAVRQPDRVPLYIHGINEAPIIGIGRHLTDGLPQPRQFHEMTDAQKMKLVDTLFLIHEAFGVDGITTFEIGHERELDGKHVMDSAAACGGYILCSSNSLHPGVNPENCIAMFQATKKYGRYA